MGIKINATSGGSVELTVDSALATDETFEFSGGTATGKVLTGASLTAVGIIGTSPQAKLWQDGSITGSSSNGTFIKWPNGEARVQLYGTLASIDTTYTFTSPIIFIAVPMATISKDGSASFGGTVYRFVCGASTTQLTAAREGGDADVTLGASGRWKV